MSCGAKLLSSRESRDYCVIINEGSANTTSFLCHRAVLSCSSPLLEAMVQGGNSLSSHVQLRPGYTPFFLELVRAMYSGDPLVSESSRLLMKDFQVDLLRSCGRRLLGHKPDYTLQIKEPGDRSAPTSIKCHRAVLMAQSAYFRKEIAAGETHFTMVVEVRSGFTGAFRALVNFMYTNRLDRKTASKTRLLAEELGVVVPRKLNIESGARIQTRQLTKKTRSQKQY